MRFLLAIATVAKVRKKNAMKSKVYTKSIYGEVHSVKLSVCHSKTHVDSKFALHGISVHLYSIEPFGLNQIDVQCTENDTSPFPMVGKPIYSLDVFL